MYAHPVRHPALDLPLTLQGSVQRFDAGNRLHCNAGDFAWIAWEGCEAAGQLEELECSEDMPHFFSRTMARLESLSRQTAQDLVAGRIELDMPVRLLSTEEKVRLFLATVALEQARNAG